MPFILLANDKIIHTVRTGYNQTDDSLTKPTHKSVLEQVMTILLDKLPYNSNRP